MQSLGSQTRMAVQEARDGEPVEADHVLVVAHPALIVERGTFRARPLPSGNPAAGIDEFLVALARDQGRKAVAVAFQGADSGVAIGQRAVREHGGLAIAVQADGNDDALRMAMQAGVVDLVLPVAQIPARLLEHARRLLVLPAEVEPERATIERLELEPSTTRARLDATAAGAPS